MTLSLVLLASTVAAVVLVATQAVIVDAQLDNYCASAGAPDSCNNLRANLCLWCGGTPLGGGRCVPQSATASCPHCSNYTSYDLRI